MDAAKAGHVDVAGFLLQSGADPLAKVQIIEFFSLYP
jgi:hypothetical protein